MSIFGRGTVRQQFEVPVFTAARAASRLRTIVIAAHLGAAALSLLDAVFLGNFLGIIFESGEIYGASFPFWMFYIHILKVPLSSFLLYVLGRTRISFGVGFLTAALIGLIVVAVWEAVTFIVLLLETAKCDDAYCFFEGGCTGTSGTETFSFNLAFYSLIFSIIIRVIEALIISFLSNQVRIRNETAIEALPVNREPLLTTGAQNLTTFQGIASNITDVESQNQSSYSSEKLINRKLQNVQSNENTYEVDANYSEGDENKHIVFD